MEIHKFNTKSCVRPGLTFKTKEYDVAANKKTKRMQIVHSPQAQGLS